MIEYRHWHTLYFGAETYWGGILPHSGRPGRTYNELVGLGVELETAGALVAGLEPDADITMVYSAPSKWVMEKYPPLSAGDGGPDAHAYHGILDPFCRGAFNASRQLRIVHMRQLHDPSGERPGVSPDDAVRRYPVLVAAGLYVVDDATVDWLAAYARAGGHLILGPPTPITRPGHGTSRHRHCWSRRPVCATTSSATSHATFPSTRHRAGSSPCPSTGRPHDGPTGSPSSTPTSWSDTSTRISAAGPQ